MGVIIEDLSQGKIKMTLHHHINSKHIEDICPYCSRTLHDKEWTSEFHIESHYKCIECECGKKVSVKVNFHGSGHDSWRDDTNKAKINKLDDLKK